jgi:hypothetical protein
MTNLTSMPVFGGFKGLALYFIHKVIHKICGYVFALNWRKKSATLTAICISGRFPV